MKLFELTSAYDNKTPAAELDKFAEREGIVAYGVEPGDMTHYTVRFEARCVLVHVGTYDSLKSEAARERVLVAVVHPCGGDKPLYINTVQGNVYQQDILHYLAALALGYDVEEPEGLTDRRKYAPQGA